MFLLFLLSKKEGTKYTSSNIVEHDMVKNIAQYHLNVIQWHHTAQSQHLNSSLFLQVNIQHWSSIKNQHDQLIELIKHRST